GHGPCHRRPIRHQGPRGTHAPVTSVGRRGPRDCGHVAARPAAATGEGCPGGVPEGAGLQLPPDQAGTGRGRMLAENLIELKMRSQPSSVYMRWLRPREFAGQEVCYVAGRNNNMMRVHPNGAKRVVGWISISPRDPRVAEQSRHVITETGLGNMMNQLGQAW